MVKYWTVTSVIWVRFPLCTLFFPNIGNIFRNLFFSKKCILLSIIILNVTLRYLFSEGRIEFEEMQWHLNSIAFLIAIAYAHRHDVHIRIDLISVRLSHRSQAWIELYGTMLLLVPFLVMVLIFSFPFVEKSWKVGEISQSPGGLPFRWLLKAVIPFSFFLLALSIFSRVSKLMTYLAGNRT